MWKFLCPIRYTFFTRLQSLRARIAWAFTYLIPSFFIVGQFVPGGFILNFISLIAIYNIYECGYIFNDAVLTRTEQFPTLRLSVTDIEQYDKNPSVIYVFRFFLHIILLTIIYCFNPALAISVLIATVVIALIFSVYNAIRSRWNIPIYSVLVWLRYYGAGLIFFDFATAVALFFIYPFTVTIEFASKKRFDIKALEFIKSHDLYRGAYYTICTLVFYVLHVYNVVCWQVLVLSLYFLVYRSTGLLISRWYRN